MSSSGTTFRRRARRTHWAGLAVTDALGLSGVVGLGCGVAGAVDAPGDAAVLVAVSALAVAAGLLGRRRLVRPAHPRPRDILTGLVVVWLALIALGALVYLATGALDSVLDAVVESTAGFTTTAVTSVDPGGLSVPVQLWRAATQWIGGYVGLLALVVAFPQALQASSLAGDPDLLESRGGAGAPRGRTLGLLLGSTVQSRRRIGALYLGVTAALALAYAATGLGAVDAAVHAMTTASTGGMSSRAGSFGELGGGPRVVATAGMIVAGASIFAWWWVVQGRWRAVLRSSGVRFYLATLAVSTAWLVVTVDGLSVGDALFTVAAAMSTTGYAVVDWAQWTGGPSMLLLLLVAAGSMVGSVGGGLRLLRTRMFVASTLRDLRRQLAPRSVVVVRVDGRAVDEGALERISGYQVAHVGLVAVSALLFALIGADVVEACWEGVSAVSTFGPAVGDIGSTGSLATTGRAEELVAAFMAFAGRLSVVPVLLAGLGLVELRRRVRHRLARRRVRGTQDGDTRTSAV